jgi:(aminoalkyl)phosphonate N-acetyltransferase
MDGLVIREVGLPDTADVCKLSGELGYPAPTDVMRRRIEELARLKDHVVYVAIADEDLVGWIHVAVVRHLQAEPRAEIGGLVVGNMVRNKGIGRELVARAEQWAVQQGVSSVVVRSQIAREAAHRFYLREGYRLTKTSAVFSKPLA